MNRCQLSRRRGWDSPRSKTDRLLPRNLSTGIARCWICPSNWTAASFSCRLYCSFKPKLHFAAVHFNTNEATKTSSSPLCCLPHLYYVLLLSSWKQLARVRTKGHPRHDVARCSRALSIDFSARQHTDPQRGEALLWNVEADSVLDVCLFHPNLFCFF